MSAAPHAALIVMNDKLELYRAMSAGEKFTPAESPTEYSRQTCFPLRPERSAFRTVPVNLKRVVRTTGFE